jgi:beta-glucosidase/6-phospho-beta-glucosidase/beta-galactosidase
MPVDSAIRCRFCWLSYCRFEEDARLAKSLGCNGFRLSLEWARLEPAQGQWDEAAIAK